MLCVLKKGKQKMHLDGKIPFHDLNDSKSLPVNEGADGGTQFSVNYYFLGQISVNYYFFGQFPANY